MRATQARVAVVVVLGLVALLAAPVATEGVTSPLKSSPGKSHVQLIPPIADGQTRHPEAADPTAGLTEAVAAHQAAHDEAVRVYLEGVQAAKAAEAARIAQEAADRQRASDAKARADRGARVRTGAVAGGVWAALRACESNGYGDKRNPRYRGAYQFSYATWASVGGTGDPADAPPDVQDALAQKLQARSGFGQWPRCARKLGLIP